MSVLDDMLKHSARVYAERLAIVWNDQRLTYRQLDERVERLARQLSAVAVPGQRIGVLLPNVPAFVIAMFAVWRNDAVAVPLNVRWREYELRPILKDVELSALLCTASHGSYSFEQLLQRLSQELPTLKRIYVIDSSGAMQEDRAYGNDEPAEPLTDDISLMHYTSGTTGEPKGVLLRGETPAHGAHSLVEVLGAEPSDVVALVLPLSHAFGLLALLVTLLAGGLSVLVESTFSLARLLQAIDTHGVTMMHGAPALFASLLRGARGELPAVRTGLVGGTICPPQLLEDLEKVGLRILNSYGMTEIGPATSCRLDDELAVRCHTVGRPLSGYTFRVVGGSPGEVQVQSRYVTPGYFRRSQETAAAFDGPWFRTGDLGAIDAQGNVCISGRTSDVIHVAGLKVFPAEIERGLLMHPDVVDVVVVSTPHESMGEAPAAFVVLRPCSQVQPQHLLQFARKTIAGYKLPYMIRLVPSFPQLATGKPDRAALARCLEEERHAKSDARS